MAAGFDLLGQALEAPGDAVSARKIPGSGVRLRLAEDSVLPAAPERNTAGRAALSLLAAMDADFGVELQLEKGIPLGSGLGGSAASAVAAVVAVNALLESRLPRQELLAHAIEGERAASDPPHPDNVAPSLLGGLIFCPPGEPLAPQTVTVPQELRSVVIHPDLTIHTQAARDALSDQVALTAHIHQSGYLAALLLGCLQADMNLIARGLRDIVVEPQRARLVKGFATVQAAAMDRGAIGCSLSGSGPAIFAWCQKDDAEEVAEEMIAAFKGAGVASLAYISNGNAVGARLL